ncbi:MAG: DUF86 domain-containing protein [Tannerella sp.]|jgi:uncharacterized protein YutE (UPF0331/DUF86 family)|nr:DUF86 domain-containing protein [Tannerella sp.]
MKYNGIVENKLRVIEEMISEIEYWNIASFALLQENVMLQRAVERELQIAIEAVIDTAERILAIEKQTPAATSVEAMEKLQKLGIIPVNSAYTDMIKFRNFIVHRYEKIDLAIVYATIKNKIPVFREFVDAVRNTK